MGEPSRVFAPVQPTRASTEVINRIREAVFSGRYRPGDRLPTERDLAKQFAVSRVTIRDALRALEASGLVTIKVGGQGGPFIAQPDVSVISNSLGTQMQLQCVTFQELAEARLALETTAARLAAERATPEDLARLDASLQDGPADATATASYDFHHRLVEASGNRALLTMFLATRELIQSAFGQLHREQPDMAESGRRAHRALYEAIAARDAETAVRIMREHLYEFAERAEHARRQDETEGSLQQRSSTGRAGSTGTPSRR